MMAGLLSQIVTGAEVSTRGHHTMYCDAISPCQELVAG